MAEKRWEFELDRARHAVKLEHNTFSGKQSVRVDGRLLQAPGGTPSASAVTPVSPSSPKRAGGTATTS